MAIIVDSPFRCTFIHSPKNGGNSISAWLLNNIPTAAVTKRKQHATVTGVIEGGHALGPINHSDLGLIFGVVRNPYSFAVSWYTFKIWLCELYIQNMKDYPDKVGKKGHKWDWEGNHKRLRELHDLEFKGWVSKTNVREQYHWLKDCQYIMRLETLDRDFKFIQHKLNCYEPLPKLNVTPRKKHWKEYYKDQETIDIVTKKYKNDIEVFGYDFG